MSVQRLRGRIALVTGASRGIGRGVAIGLGEEGATVYVTGRTMEAGGAGLGRTVPETAALVTEAGGEGIAVRCDHSVDSEIAAVFERIQKEQGRIDVLVNNVTAVPNLGFLFGSTPFWELESSSWDDLMRVGLRSHFIAAQHAARMMIKRHTGLIVNISSAAARRRIGVLPYGVAKAGLDRMTSDMAEELAEHRVAVVSLWPPATATEGMLAEASPEDDPGKWLSPVFTGRVVAALAAESNVIARSGNVLIVKTVAPELGVEEVRGSRA